MNRKYLRQGLLCFVLICGLTGSGLASGPQEQIKGTTDKVLSLLTDPNLKGPGKVKERREQILKIVDERFDWEEMARRALARHWKERSTEEKKDFISLFRELLERVYADKVEGYSWNKITYEEERIEGNYALVKMKIFTAKEQIIQVEYRVWKKGDIWLVYDFMVEGVSLVNNYRTQFNEIMTRHSYTELVKRLKAKSGQH